MGKNIRWIIVLLLFLVYMINYLDRVALSITVPMIEKDLALNAEQFGIIFGSFFFGYAVFNFIGGLAVDKFGATLTDRPLRQSAFRRKTAAAWCLVATEQRPAPARAS